MRIVLRIQIRLREKSRKRENSIKHKIKNNKTTLLQLRGAALRPPGLCDRLASRSEDRPRPPDAQALDALRVEPAELFGVELCGAGRSLALLLDLPALLSVLTS